MKVTMGKEGRGGKENNNNKNQPQTSQIMASYLAIYSKSSYIAIATTSWPWHHSCLRGTAGTVASPRVTLHHCR